MRLSRQETGLRGTLFHGAPIAPISLYGVAYADVNVDAYRRLLLQSDVASTPSAKLYYRIDHSATCANDTLANFKPEGFLTYGGDVKDLWISPRSGSPPSPALSGSIGGTFPAVDATPEYLHLLLVTNAGVPIIGGVADQALITNSKDYADV